MNDAIESTFGYFKFFPEIRNCKSELEITKGSVLVIPYLEKAILIFSILSNPVISEIHSHVIFSLLALISALIELTVVLNKRSETVSETPTLKFP